MATKQHSRPKAVRGVRADIKAPIGDKRPTPGAMAFRLQCIRTLIEAAQIVNDGQVSVSILSAAKGLIVDAEQQLAAGGAA